MSGDRPLSPSDYDEAEKQFYRDLDERGVSLGRRGLQYGLSADGSWPRADALNKKGKGGRGDVQYVLDLYDGWPRWTIINYTDGLGWRSGYYSKTDRPLTLEEQSLVDEAVEKNRRNAEAARERQDRQWAEVASQCLRRWEQAPQADSAHPYLIRKNVRPYGLRQEGVNLLVPMIGEDGRLQSLQMISPDGAKMYAKGGKSRGGLFPIEGTVDTVYVAEGFATGATVAELTGATVIVAFDSGKILAAGERARRIWPEAKIVFAADDDWQTKGNPGVKSATEAAIAVNGFVAVPDFSGVERGDKDTDFNDMRRLARDAATRAALEKAVLPGLVPPTKEGEISQVVALIDFYAHMPTHTYIFVPTREPWPKVSVDSRLGKRASTWLDRNRPVEQMTWAPGLPLIIENRLTSEGGWIERGGVSCFNLYRPPTIRRGVARGAERWVEHVRAVYPDDADWIVAWLAHRVQRPGEKVNHALVFGGLPGIGKDSILEPVKRAVGSWNFQEVSPIQLLARFNGFLKSVIVRVSEVRDMGEIDRFQLYDHMKVFLAAPPDVLRIDEKNLREYSVVNCVGVIITTNHRDGLYLPADDRRHYVAWSELKVGELSSRYFNELWRYFDDGGDADVASFLREYDLRSFDPKAPPRKTEAFWAVVNAGRSNEDAELEDILERMGNPRAITIDKIAAEAAGSDFARWLGDRRSQRVIPHRMEACGYCPIKNPDSTKGLWRIANGSGTRRVVVYALTELSVRDRIEAATNLARGSGRIPEENDEQMPF